MKKKDQKKNYSIIIRFAEQYCAGVRESSLVQRIAVPVFSALLSFLFLISVYGGIPAFSNQTLMIWLLPMFVMTALFLPYRSPMKSVFWYFRSALLVGYALLMVKLIMEFQNYLFKEPYPSTVTAIIVLLLIWCIPATVVYYLSEKEKKEAAVDSLRYSHFRSFLFACTPCLRVKNEEGKQRTHLVLHTVLRSLFCLIGAGLISAGLFIAAKFPNMDMEAVLFTVRFANNSYSTEVRKWVILITAIVLIHTLCTAVCTMRYDQTDIWTVHSLSGEQQAELKVSPKRSKRIVLILILQFIAGLVIVFNALDTVSFIKRKSHQTHIYENYYVDPTQDILHFPERKKNLVYIYLESYENTFTSFAQGGNQEQDYMPELYALAEKNLNFSHCAGIGGQQVFFPTTRFTMGATVAQTSGCALMTVHGMITNEQLGSYSDMLPSLRRLEDILHDEGYNQLFIRGEDTHFAGYNNYVGRYENSTIYDYNSAKEENRLADDYSFQWGMEDYILFPIIKEKMTELAEKGAPFCTTIYTVDTHSNEGGNNCPLCDNSVENRYAKAVRCSSRQVSDFMNWLSEQPYYEDTVIILVGDHLADLTSVGIRFGEDDYIRTTYNCFIHAQKTPEKPNSRVFSSMDMFPTTLSALGVEIDGSRLGLGTDLFSDQLTLCEMLGAEQFVEEIQMSSDYYNERFWKKES